MWLLLLNPLSQVRILIYRNGSVIDYDRKQGNIEFSATKTPMVMWYTVLILTFAKTKAAVFVSAKKWKIIWFNTRWLRCTSDNQVTLDFELNTLGYRKRQENIENSGLWSIQLLMSVNKRESGDRRVNINWEVSNYDKTKSVIRLKTKKNLKQTYIR